MPSRCDGTNAPTSSPPFLMARLQSWIIAASFSLISPFIECLLVSDANQKQTQAVIDGKFHILHIIGSGEGLEPRHGL